MGRTTKELAGAIELAGPGGTCVLKGEDGNVSVLTLDNLAAVEGWEIDLPNNDLPNN